MLAGGLLRGLRGAEFRASPLMVFARQLVPLDGERAAGGGVLAVPIRHEVDAGVIHVIESHNGGT